MKTTKTLLFAILLVGAGSGTASAVMQPRPTFQTSGASGGTYISGGGSCETSSWGNSSSGGTTTACAYPDGTNTWFMNEWGLGWSSSVYGSASPDGTVTETAYDNSGT